MLGAHALQLLLQRRLLRAQLLQRGLRLPQLAPQLGHLGLGPQGRLCQRRLLRRLRRLQLRAQLGGGGLGGGGLLLLDHLQRFWGNGGGWR